jgi:hypothetical protein
MTTNKYPDPWATTSVYKVQCKSYTVAKELTGDFRNVSGIEEYIKPPFCLRLLPAYRTESVQAFRNAVAAELRLRRRK